MIAVPRLHGVRFLLVTAQTMDEVPQKSCYEYLIVFVHDCYISAPEEHAATHVALFVGQPNENDVGQHLM